jgi:hypothetical protein
MAELVTEFNDACSRVEPAEADVTNAAGAHRQVRECLEQDETLKGYGIDTILIGSYSRSVSIRRVKDVDVFSKLPDLDPTVTSTAILDLFDETLSQEFPNRIERQDRSIKVDFPDFGLHVDAVPARPAGDYWEIPDRISEDDPDSKDNWQQTNPEGLGDKSTEMNDKDHFNRKYVPVVKLIRQTRRSNLGRRPGGLFFEVLTYHAFAGFSDDMRDKGKQRLYVAALRSVATQLAEFAAGGDISDPSMPGESVTIRASEAEIAAAVTRFTTLADDAEEALNADPCPAAKTFHDMFGKNADDETVFKLPDYCNADGTKRTDIRSSTSKVPAGRDRFG